MSLDGSAPVIEKVMAEIGEGTKRVDGKLLKEAKRRKFLQKQSGSATSDATVKQTAECLSWIESNSSFAQFVSDDAIEEMRNDPSSPLAPYFDLQDRPSSLSNSQRRSKNQLFIAEGSETIRLLLRQLQRSRNQLLGPIQVRSIFVKPSILASLRPEVDSLKKEFGTVPFDIIVAENSTQSDVVGFGVSRGALACGVVPTARDWNWLLQYLQSARSSQPGSADSSSKPLRLIALDGISDTANLGSIIRTAAAFSIDAILLSSSCCDAWYRRTVRVSMGHVFHVPCVRVEDLAGAIRHLAADPYQVTFYAAIVQQETDLILERVDKGCISPSWAAVFGNEASGITDQVVTACDHTIRIGMDEDVDSLSLPIAAGILLHGLKERSK